MTPQTSGQDYSDPSKMYARLNRAYGWTWQYEDGSWGPFILENVERYAGMLAGWTPNGRKCARPVSEFEALSHDGIDWYPTNDLISRVKEEGHRRVRFTDLSLPVAFDEDQT